MLTTLEHMVTHQLLYTGDCKLLGVTDDGQIYVEELYGEDDWLAQHCVSVESGIIKSVDEAQGNNLNIAWLELPVDVVKPNLRACCEPLQFSGARLRGIYEDERIDELVHPLTISDKMELVEFMEWDIEPLQIIGVAESVVLAHTQVDNEMQIVCRRVKVAYRLNQPTQDYDYDSLDVYCLHEYVPADNPPDLVDCLNDMDDVVLLRPMDCLYHNNRLYIADGGEGDDVSAIHVFERPAHSENS